MRFADLHACRPSFTTWWWLRRRGARHTAPAIASVVNGASFQPGVSANSWVTIQGTNLAPQTDDWSHSIVNGVLPTSLDGVSVSMGGKAAYVYYISPGQLNVLAPDVPAGPVTVTVTTAGRCEHRLRDHRKPLWSGIFHCGHGQPSGRRDAPRLQPCREGRHVRRRDHRCGQAWRSHYPLGNRLRSHHAGSAIGRIVPASGGYPTASAPTVTINNTPAIVYGAALAPGSAGLYQIAIQVPTTLADGDWPIQASIGGVTVAHRDCSFDSTLITRETMTLQRAAFYPLAALLIHASLGFGQPTIKLIAGGNGLAPIGDGGPAVNAFIGQAGNITVDAAGNLYIWDATDSRVRKVNTAGIISSVTATVGQLKEIGRTRWAGDRQRRQPLHRRYPVLCGPQGGYFRGHDHDRRKRNSGDFRHQWQWQPGNQRAYLQPQRGCSGPRR